MAKGKQTKWKKAIPVRTTPTVVLARYSDTKNRTAHPDIQRNKKGEDNSRPPLGSQPLGSHLLLPDDLFDAANSLQIYRVPPKALMRAPEDLCSRLCLLKSPGSRGITSLSPARSSSSSKIFVGISLEMWYC